MARVDVVMPKMGESVMEGTVLEWKKQVGDVIEQDETLLEISTDKVDSEVPAPDAGRLVEILVEEGDTVDVGTPIAVIETDVNAEVGSGSSDDAPDAEAAEPAPVAGPVIEAAGEPADAAPPADEPQPAEEEAEAPAASSGDGAAPSAAPAGGGERIEVVMPKMGESVMEGTVLTWSKQVGDEVELDETLLEISTDKVDSEVPSPAAGVLVEILVEEGETVEVGTPIAIVASGDAATAPVAAPTAEREPETIGTAPSADEPSSAPDPAEKSYGMTGEVLAGDGAPMAEPVPVGEAPGSESGAGSPIPRRSDSGRFYSPLVRSIAEAEGLSLTELERVEGSGAEGRVTKQDVMGYLENRGAQPVPQPTAQPEVRQAPASAPQKAAPSRPAAPAPAATEAGDRVEVIEMDRMRQLIAEHMTRSKATSAHVTSFTEVDMTGIVQHREAHKKAFQEREGTKLTFTPYFILAAVEPLREHPLLNSSVEGKRVLVKKDFHIGIAVAIGKKGLLVPIVRHAGQQNLTGLTHTLADLAERTRNKQLLPDELQGGTFTITNVGSLGSLMGTPIINQPQVAILSPGAIVKRPVVVEDPSLGDVIAIRHMMYVSLSYDHRIIDGAMAASFLRAYRERLEGITATSELF
ncbi:MAG: 2-oxoglutarate dehydrogenase, E2 component, dihydrolipoamide succinyltransferase [Rhodothermaceae bacterium]|nr:2-oxoglutarate dehydrogenase, E2 component, dihydrolipoamide succinyltransferase [Rhodothermaceae bacterium]